MIGVTIFFLQPEEDRDLQPERERDIVGRRENMAGMRFADRRWKCGLQKRAEDRRDKGCGRAGQSRSRS